MQHAIAQRTVSFLAFFVVCCLFVVACALNVRVCVGTAGVA